MVGPKKARFLAKNQYTQRKPLYFENTGSATQRAKIPEKVHKPPLGVNIIKFELNGFNAFIWVPWGPLDTKKL